MASVQTELPKDLDVAAMETRCRELWERERIYAYDASAPGELFSVDTPPPYVSAAHLHVGHAMSYAQAEFVIRYQRMNGKRVFYPMGFDDNGLPTERYVEKTYQINKRKTSRAEFRKLCLEETRKGAKGYEDLWRKMGLSVDWRLRYSTIDDHCRRTAQKSFLDLYRKGRLYRAVEPVMWDTHFETAIAQADLETLERKGQLNDVAFNSADGSQELIISTTRPELIPGCVALYCHPEDGRYAHLRGGRARVPLFGYEVPILADEEVDPAFGTGLMMVCTFGDGEDVRRWKRDGLETRLCIGPDGKMLPLTGEFEGLEVGVARKKILAALKEGGQLRGQTTTDQAVSVSERSGVPVEFNMAPHWFIRVLDIKAELLKRSAELKWYPEWMKPRLDAWIEGLKYDWNITRQRFYGVPFPVWYGKQSGKPVFAEEAQLPVDPLEEACPLAVHPETGETEFVGDPDVMDTWMTSSLTPLINANWAQSPGRHGGMELFPNTVRVQAFEIIRTWLFYTVVKADAHEGTIPWRDVMISGWGLNEQGKKISKRDLEQFTDGEGYNRYEPYGVIQKYGADALRYWAASTQLGSDARYHEKEVKNGRKTVLKLWNAARFALGNLEGFDPAGGRLDVAERTPEDRWLLGELEKAIAPTRAAFESYNYGVARQRVDEFFWHTFCDNYLEIVKDRFWHPERYPEAYRRSSQATLWEVLREVLGLFAPFLPFVTEEIYQLVYRTHEDMVSLHITAYPRPRPERVAEVPEMATVLAILDAVRKVRSERQIGQTRALAKVLLDAREAEAAVQEHLKRMALSIQAVTRADAVEESELSEGEEALAGVRVEVVAQ